MSKHLILVVVVACIAGIAYNSKPLTPVDGGGTAPIKPPPSLSLQQAVAPLKTVPASHHDMARELAGLYRQIAVAVQRTQAITTLGQFADAHSAILREFLVQFEQQPIGIGGQIDAVLITHLGGADGEIPDIPLDTTTRAKLAEALDAIAWAMEGN